MVRRLIGLSRHRLVRRVAILATGTAAAQAITLAATPLVSRLYGPEAFGLLGTYAATLAIISPAAALGLPMTLPLPDRDQAARALFRLSILCALSITALAAAFLFGAYFLVWPTGERELGQAIVLWLPLGLLSAACGEALRYWLVRRNAFQSIAFTTLISSAAINGLKLTFGGIHPTGTTLIAITVLGAALNTLLMLRTAYQDLRSHLGEILQVNIRENINLLKRYRDYPLYRAPQNIIGAASQGFPVILLTINFGAASAGYYSVGAVLLGAPSALLGTAVRDVFYPHVAAAGRDGHNIHHLIRKATLAIAATCIWPFLLVVAFGPILFEPLLGSEWARAGEYARWISIFFFFRLLVRPAVAAVPILGLESGLLAYEVITTAAKFIAMALAIVMFRNDILAIGVFSVASAASYAALLVWIMSRSRKNDVQASPDDDAG